MPRLSTTEPARGLAYIPKQDAGGAKAYANSKSKDQPTTYAVESKSATQARNQPYGLHPGTHFMHTRATNPLCNNGQSAGGPDKSPCQPATRRCAGKTLVADLLHPLGVDDLPSFNGTRGGSLYAPASVPVPPPVVRSGPPTCRCSPSCLHCH